MNQHTPEKVADLIKEARTWAALIGTKPRGARELFNRLADALEAVSAERDTLLGPDSDDRDELITAPIIRALRIAKAERDEALAAIAEARAHEWSNYGDSETHRILSRIPEHPKED